MRDYKVDFIDPLFAVVLGTGFSATYLGNKWTGSGTEIATLLLANLVVVLSWAGYHESIKYHPVRGILRFVLDVFILATYMFMILAYRSVPDTLWWLGASYALFFLWDLCKHVERRSREGWGRSLCTLVFLVLSWALVSLWSQARSMYCLAGGYAIVVFYRFAKAALAKDSSARKVLEGLFESAFGPSPAESAPAQPGS